MTVYQVITVSHSHFSNSVIPDAYAFDNQFEAEMDIKKRIASFAQNGEVLNYKGVIHSVDDILKYIRNILMQNIVMFIYM